MADEDEDEDTRSIMRENIGKVTQEMFIKNLEVRLDQHILQFLGISETSQ